ncbi:hypothetical protein TruAng_007309 [Truncatella angustata]|nr:hypothetical protein TruAng_007309 [Truncatella angustata]
MWRIISLLFSGYLVSQVALVQGAIVKGRAFDRFISIWLENQDFAKVIEDADFAELKKHGISQTRYYAQTHPSQPNYLASVAGDYFGLNHDEVVRVPKNVSTVVDLLEDKNISWGGYFEGNPGPGYMAAGSYAADGSGTWDYVRKHNHFVSFDSINKDGSRLAKLLSFEDFKRELAAGTLPQFIMMSPDMLNDGHNTTLSYATNWAHEFLLPLLADDAFAEPTVIQLTYDESEDYGKPNQIVSLLLGNGIPKDKKGTEDNDFYTHYSVLATTQNNWSLSNLGRYDVGANVFKFVAGVTGYANKDPENAGSVDNSISYAGYLNNESNAQAEIPSPNLKLTGAGGQPILEHIRKAWQADEFKKTPYDDSGKVFDGDKNVPEYKLQE